MPKSAQECENLCNVPLEAKLLELRQNAAEKGKDKLVLTFARALKSIRRCKDPIQTTQELQKLKHIGPFCADQLKGALREARVLSGLPECGGDGSNSFQVASYETSRPRKRRRARPFRPEAGEAAWIFLVSLYKRQDKSLGDSPTLSEIEDEAEILVVEFGLRVAYFANAVERVAEELKARGLVDVSGREERRRWSLTDQGKDCAMQLWSEHMGKSAPCEAFSSQSSSISLSYGEHQKPSVEAKTGGASGMRWKKSKTPFCAVPGDAVWVFLVVLYQRTVKGRSNCCTLSDLERDAESFAIKFDLRRCYFHNAVDRVDQELEGRGLVVRIGEGDERLYRLTQDGKDAAALLWAQHRRSEIQESPTKILPSDSFGVNSSQEESCVNNKSLTEDISVKEIETAEVGAVPGSYSSAMTHSCPPAADQVDKLNSPFKSFPKLAWHSSEEPVRIKPSAREPRPSLSKQREKRRIDIPLPFRSFQDLSVILIQDHRESQKNDVQSHLLQRGVSCENRVLHLGDMVWIAQDPLTQQEYVLDFIIERKSAPDLAQSIVDGRYMEQKTRLRACGIKHVTYLVEGAVTGQERLPKQTLRTAMAETRVLPGFRVLQTNNIAQSAEELRRMHEQIKSLMKAGGDDARSLFVFDETAGMPLLFTEFQVESRKPKSYSAGEIFARMLCQVPKFSHVTSLGIVEHFPTLRCAIEHAEGLSVDNCVNVYKKVRGETQSRGAPQKSLEVFAKVLTQLDYCN